MIEKSTDLARHERITGDILTISGRVPRMIAILINICGTGMD
jgi:hypothetical protein